MRSLTKLTTSNSEHLDAVVALAKLLAKADSNIVSAITDDDFLKDVADVIAALVTRETKALANRVTLLEVALGAHKSVRPTTKGRAKPVKL